MKSQSFRTITYCKNGDIIFPEPTEQDIQTATTLVREYDSASTAFIQRRMKIGYCLAAAILDELELRGVVGPFDGDRPREVKQCRMNL